MTLPTKVNGTGAEAPTPPAPKPRRKAKLKRFHVLEYVDTIEARDEEEVRSRLPKKRAFEIREVKS